MDETLVSENKVPQSAIDNLFSAYPESTYPSRALTMKDYKYATHSFPDVLNFSMSFRQKLCKLPTLCFRKTVEVSNVLIVPDFKQDSKDLSRDIIRLNGKELPGRIEKPFLLFCSRASLQALSAIEHYTKP